MNFNKGFICTNCGPIEKAAKKTIKKVQYNICAGCGSVVMEWERPLKERPGRCGNCAGGGFKLAIVKHQLLRCCKTCQEVINPDSGEIKRRGNTRWET
jgi:hypothetical protein